MQSTQATAEVCFDLGLSQKLRPDLSNMAHDFEEIMERLNCKIQEGQELLVTLRKFRNIPGIAKLTKKIQKELDFLVKFQQNPNKLKVEHLQCSNLLHLSAIVQALVECQKPTHILRSFHNQENKKVVVDIVCEDGFHWIKVIARSPAALERLSTGDQAYGQRSFIGKVLTKSSNDCRILILILTLFSDQAKDYVSASETNLHHFKPPTLVFVFHAGVPENAAEKLKNLGISIHGEIVPTTNFDYDEDEDDEDDEDENDENFHDENILLDKHQSINSSVLNLDITAMIAYVSALTNGYANYEFQETILSQQAGWERQKPAKPILDEIFRDKRLITCQSAMEDFQTILDTLGGPGEKARAEEFLKQVEVVPDQMSDKVMRLKTGGKVRERSKVIFGTGDILKVVTVSANSGFVRAAQSQNINLAVINHESRALTEGKMKTAKAL